MIGDAQVNSVLEFNGSFFHLIGDKFNQVDDFVFHVACGFVKHLGIIHFERLVALGTGRNNRLCTGVLNGINIVLCHLLGLFDLTGRIQRIATAVLISAHDLEGLTRGF